MLCCNCPFTDGLCYTSMPPQVKCTITNEFHFYGDECNCVEAYVNKEAELEQLKVKYLDKPICQEILNRYSPLDGIANSSKIRTYGFNDWQTSAIAAEAIVPRTSCLVCGADIMLSLCEGGPKICTACKKAIKFIKERFKEELENYEM